MKIHLKALGCRLNEAELEQWSREFTGGGHMITQDPSEADVVVVNTCAVTTEATKKSRKLMNRLHRENPQSKLVVSGCYATLEESKVADRLGVDLVINNQNKDSLPQRVMDDFSANTMPQIAMEPAVASLFSRGKQRAFIKIQDGCRYRCTYCIVTLARGEERSRSLDEIVGEVNDLYSEGIQEIVLTGVHVGGYGSDTGSSLYQLVETLLNETDIPRIRFASVEPWDLPEVFLGLFENKRLMPHMHLPLQSGADSVLRRMSRRCRVDDFRNMVRLARSSIDGFNVTTDIIVGFPDESEEEWRQTLEAVESIGFGHIHIFSFSPREGTKAAHLDNPIEESVKKLRSRELHQLADQQKLSSFRSQLNKCVDVLWESKKTISIDKHRYVGYTPNFMKIETIVPSDGLLEGKVTSTIITGISTESTLLTGVIVRDDK